MTHSIDETVAIIGDIVLQATPATGTTAGEVLEALAPGNGRVVVEPLFAVACRFGDISDDTEVDAH